MVGMGQLVGPVLSGSLSNVLSTPVPEHDKATACAGCTAGSPVAGCAQHQQVCTTLHSRSHNIATYTAIHQHHTCW